VPGELWRATQQLMRQVQEGGELERTSVRLVSVGGSSFSCNGGEHVSVTLSRFFIVFGCHLASSTS